MSTEPHAAGPPPRPAPADPPLRRTHNHHGGRPLRAARLDLRLSISELADLRAIAAAGGRTVSAYIRWALLYRLRGPVRPCDPAHCPLRAAAPRGPQE